MQGHGRARPRPLRARRRPRRGLRLLTAVAHRFATPLVAGTLVRRYKRFLADVTLDDGRDVIAHCPSPGSMAGLADPGSRVWLSPANDPRRKLAWTWEIASDGGVRVGFDGQRSNRLVEDAVHAGLVAELAGYAEVRREVPYGERSRVDLLLTGRSGDRRPCWVEVKTVTLRGAAVGPAAGDEGVAVRFPDAVTERGRRHLDDLAARADAGDRAVIFFLAQRADAAAVEAAGDVDPAYAEAFARARARGVEALAWRADATPEAITLLGPVPVR